MILPIHELIKTQIRAVAKRLYGLDDTAMPSITIQIPPNRTIGDLAVPVAFELAKVARKAPRVISTELVDALGEIDGVTAIEPSPNGYINFFLDRRSFLTNRINLPVQQWFYLD